MKESFHSLKTYLIFLGLMNLTALSSLDFSTIPFYSLAPSIFFGFAFIFIGVYLKKLLIKWINYVRLFLLIAFIYGLINLLVSTFLVIQSPQFANLSSTPLGYILFIPAVLSPLVVVYLFKNIEKIAQQLKTDETVAVYGEEEKSRFRRSLVYFAILVAIIGALAYLVVVSIRNF